MKRAARTARPVEFREPVADAGAAGALRGRPVAKSAKTKIHAPALGEADRAHTLIRETLLQIAARHEKLDTAGCDLLFALVETGQAIRRHLIGALTSHGLSEAKFCALVLLHSLDPEPSTPADLAYHSGVSRSAMTDVLDQMVAQGWVRRERSLRDRRTLCIRLEPTGRKFADRAIASFMDTTAELLAGLEKGRRVTVAGLCAALSRRLGKSADSVFLAGS